MSATALPTQPVARRVPVTARGELFRALGAFAEPPGPSHASIAAALGPVPTPSAADYAEVFLFAVYPYASVYLGAEGMLGGEARDRVAGFWRALGLVPPTEPDHLATLLGLYAALVDEEAASVAGGDATAAAARRRARTALLWEHLLPWLPVFADAVSALGASPYAGWAELVRAALADESAELAAEAPLPLPLALREAPGLPAQDAPAADWIAALLGPVRSGIVLTRPDLARGAAALGIGVRAGERTFMLRSMLEQDARATAGWLADEADRWSARHRSRAVGGGVIDAFWQGRADGCALALRGATERSEGR